MADQFATRLGAGKRRGQIVIIISTPTAIGAYPSINRVRVRCVIRFFQDALKCRREAFGDAPIPASTLLNVPQLAWPYMMIEVDVTAMLAK